MFGKKRFNIVGKIRVENGGAFLSMTVEKYRSAQGKACACRLMLCKAVQQLSRKVAGKETETSYLVNYYNSLAILGRA